MGEGPTPVTLLRDHRIARLAIQAPPVWLWRADLTGALWANAAGAACLRASSLQVLVTQRFSPTDPRLAQVARIASMLYPGGTQRLARLRGLAPGIGQTLLCTVSRIVVDNVPAILSVAQETAGIDLPLAARIAFLLAEATEPVAAFMPAGRLVAATPSARALVGPAEAASAIGAESLVTAALAEGISAGDTAHGRVRMIRVGDEDATALIAYFIGVSGHRSGHAVGEDAGAYPRTAAGATGTDAAPPQRIDPPLPDRRLPLRFVWQMDQLGRFTLGSEEFIEAIGSRTALLLGRPWREIAAELDLDRENAVLQAIETRQTWSGIVVSFPIAHSADRIRVELSGLPVYDRDRTYLGYRGFGVCRDVERLTQLGWNTRGLALPPTDPVATVIMPDNVETALPQGVSIDDADAILAFLHQTDGALSIGPEPELPESELLEQVPFGEPVDEPTPSETENILLFPAAAPEGKSRADAATASAPTALSVGERDAFQEIARRLQARLAAGAQSGLGAAHPVASDATMAPPRDATSADEPSVFPMSPGGDRRASGLTSFLDGLPAGIMVYRHGRPLYANHAFLAATGFARLEDLTEAGALDALPAGTDAGTASGPGRIGPLVTIIGRGDTKAPISARLIAVPWAEESALALVLLNQSDMSDHDEAAALALHRNEIQLRQLRAIIDTSFDGLIVLCRDGRIVSANRSAEALFACAPAALINRPFADLFALESRGTALTYLDRVRRGEGFIPGGREMTGETHRGRDIPLAVILGMMPDGTDEIYAIFRDLTPRKKAEAEMAAERRDAERAVTDHADLLDKLSTSVRGAVTSMTGVVDLMLEERFGPLGNERYRGCLRELRAASDHIGGLVDNVNSLSRAESEPLDLSFVPVDFNALVQGCIKTLQAEANRDRIIIRSALAPRLRAVLADAQSLQQVVSNLLANAIRHAGAGGQVIVSTGETERGHVVFRVRDTGASGLRGADLSATARKETEALHHSRGASIDMVLTRTLAEANRGTLHISSKANEGTLFEVSFPGARIPAE